MSDSLLYVIYNSLFWTFFASLVSSINKSLGFAQVGYRTERATVRKYVVKHGSLHM